jgi:hypothetical protein
LDTFCLSVGPTARASVRPTSCPNRAFLFYGDLSKVRQAGLGSLSDASHKEVWPGLQVQGLSPSRRQTEDTSKVYGQDNRDRTLTPHKAFLIALLKVWGASAPGWRPSRSLYGSSGGLSSLLPACSFVHCNSSTRWRRGHKGRPCSVCSLFFIPSRMPGARQDPTRSLCLSEMHNRPLRLGSLRL